MMDVPQVDVFHHHHQNNEPVAVHGTSFLSSEESELVVFEEEYHHHHDIGNGHHHHSLQEEILTTTTNNNSSILKTEEIVEEICTYCQTNSSHHHRTETTTITNQNNRRFSLQAGVYGCSKTQYYDPTFCQKLYQEHELTLGEDFYFYTNCFMGVSDGVGGWSSYYGVDSSRVSKDIMNLCKYFAEEEETKSFGKNDNYNTSSHSSNECTCCSLNKNNQRPSLNSCISLNTLHILTKAYEKELDDYQKLCLDQPLGSTTACVVQINERNGKLTYSNIGDSGFIVLRKEEVATTEQKEKAFVQQQYKLLFVAKDKCHYISGLGKAPFQLSLLPQRLIETKNYFSDKPSDGIFEEECIQLLEGDLIIMGSDGLFDNIDAEYILEFMNDAFPPKSDLNLSEKLDMKEISRSLAELARNQYRKIDDVVCLCAQVVLR
ncbi:hypothetical protein ABK040_001462 [Willaertia magna]